MAEDLIQIDFRLTEFKDRLKEAADYLAPWQKEAKKDFKYYSGKQWEDKDERHLEEQNKAPLVINKVRPFIDAVSGTEITNRYVPKFFPRNSSIEEGDVQGSELLSQVYRWIRDQTDVEQEESAAFRDCAICGVGVTATEQDYLDNPDGQTLTDRVNPMEVGWDPTAVKPGVADRRYELRGRWYPMEEFRTRWAEKEEEVLGLATQMRGGAFQQTGSSGTPNLVSAWRYTDGKSQLYDYKTRSILIWHYIWWEVEWQYRIMPPEGEPYWVSTEDFPEHLRIIQQQLELAQTAWQEQGGPQSGLPPPPDPNSVEYVHQPRKLYYEAWLAGDKVLLEARRRPVDEFSLNFITGFEDRAEDGTVSFFGLMRPARDPQRWVNKFFSQAIHHYNLNAKGLLITEKGAFVNESAVEKEWAKPDGKLVVREQTLSMGRKPFEVVNTAAYPSGTESLLRFADSVLPQVFGINPEYFAGMATDLRRTATSAVQSIQRQNLVTLAPLFDSLRLYRKRQARMILSFVREYMPEGQVIRITGESGVEYVQFSKSIAAQEYDIVVEEAPASKTERQEIFNNFMQHGTFNELLSQGLVGPKLLEFFLVDAPAEAIQEVVEDFKSRRELMQLQIQVQKLQLMQMMQGGGMPPQQAPPAGGEEVQPS